MDLELFWATVESARADVVAPTDDAGDALAAALVQRLAATSPENILDFQEEFDRAVGALNRWDVWAAAYLIGGGCSDDSFADFRAGVIGLGRDWFDRVVANPDDLADHPIVREAAGDEGRDDALFAESVGCVARMAYEEISGEDEEFYEALDARQGADSDEDEDEDEVEDEYEYEPRGEDFDFDDDAEMRRRLPRLAELFLGPTADGSDGQAPSKIA